jgi:hypothetical protein
MPAMLTAITWAILCSPSKPPAWFDKSVAGYVLQWDDKHPGGCFFDSKKGFYVMRVPECDGSHLSLILTRDRKMVAGSAFHVKDLPKSMGENGYDTVHSASFRSLATGKGISIGDSQSVVRAKLGAPSKQEKAGNRKQFLEWTYLWRDVKKGVGAEWQNIYVFKTGKLIEVRFHRDSVPGCGD